MALQIQKATEKDRETLLALTEQARKYKLSLGDHTWGEDPFTEDDMNLRLKVNRTYLAYVDEEIAGSITLLWNDEHNWGKKGTDQRAGYIHGLMVGDAFRGQKIGEQMISWAIKQASDFNRRYVRLDCSAENRKLRSYYEKLGFECTYVKNGIAFYELTILKRIS